MSKELKIDKKLDDSLKPIKVDGESTSIEISKDDARVKNLLEAAKLIVSELSSGKIHTNEITSGDDISIKPDGQQINFKTSDGNIAASWNFLDPSATLLYLFESGGASQVDYFSIMTIANGNTTIQTKDDSDSNSAPLTIIADGALTLTGATTTKLESAGGDTTLDASTGIYKFLLDSDADDLCTLTIAANGETTLTTADSDGAVGHLNIEPDGHVEFDNCAVGFDLLTPTYNASDTDVSFINGNKQFVTFGAGNITDLNLIFPATSGNFVLLVKQDGTGSRTITNYKAWDLVNSDAASGSATVKFAGGSNPTLTTDANHVDILSFFWDADNQIAYGVASLDFQF